MNILVAMPPSHRVYSGFHRDSQSAAGLPFVSTYSLVWAVVQKAVIVEAPEGGVQMQVANGNNDTNPY